MDIQRRHEDGEHNRLILQILRLIDALDGYYLSIYGAYYQILRIPMEYSLGAAEEIEDEAIEKQRNRRAACRQNPWGEEEPRRNIHRQQDDE